MKTTMVARRRVCSPREGGSAAPSRGSAAAYRAGGRMLRPQLFLPTLVRAAGPGCRMPGGRMLARRSSCARRGRSRGGGGESGGRRGRPGCSQRAPGAGRRRARPLLWPPARPQPSLPSCTKRAGTHRAWHRAECRECPPNCCAQGESCRIIHINHTWSPLGPATLQTGVLAFTPVCPTGRSWEALCLQASTLGICCSVADHPHIPTMSPSTAASRSLEPVALGDNRASDQSNQ